MNFISELNDQIRELKIERKELIEAFQLLGPEAFHRRIRDIKADLMIYERARYLFLC